MRDTINKSKVINCHAVTCPFNQNKRCTKEDGIELNDRGECIHYPPQFVNQLRRARPSSPFMHKE